MWHSSVVSFSHLLHPLTSLPIEKPQSTDFLQPSSPLTQTFSATHTSTPSWHSDEAGVGGGCDHRVIPHILLLWIKHVQLTDSLAQRSRWAALLSQSLLNEAADCSCCELNTTADSHRGFIKPPKACKHLTSPAFCKLREWCDSLGALALGDLTCVVQRRGRR